MGNKPKKKEKIQFLRYIKLTHIIAARATIAVGSKLFGEVTSSEGPELRLSDCVMCEGPSS